LQPTGRFRRRSLSLVVHRKRMEVSVTVDLSVAPQEKHIAAMQSAARSLTDNLKSVRVTCSPTALKKIRAEFSVADARQEDVVDRIGRRFWQVEDYQNSSIGFSPRRNRRTDAREGSQHR
jgi:hypothetical protein